MSKRLFDWVMSSLGLLALGPLLMGWLKDVTGNFNAGIFMVAGFLVLGAAVIALIPMKTAVKQRAL